MAVDVPLGPRPFEKLVTQFDSLLNSNIVLSAQYISKSLELANHFFIESSIRMYIFVLQ